MKQLKVLVLARSYPNNIQPHLGLWTEGFVQAISKQCEVCVVSPVPYCPPLPSRISYTRFRRIERRQRVNGIEVFRPRFLVGPGYLLHSFEADAYGWGVHREVERLHREFEFNLIHAQFSYPDGVVAARLGKQYKVPMLITEHAPWRPWMDNYPRVRRQAVWASSLSASHIVVSRYVQETIAHFTGEPEKLHVIHVGVDGSLFTPLPTGHKPDPNRILYVGQINFNKGVDILLQAMRLLVERRPSLRLTLIGGSFYRHQRLQEQKIRSLAKEPGLRGCVEFLGERSPHEVAEQMRQNALLVLPSRAESFGAVLVEALACGTPVVATRCGGPEDIVTEDVGMLVPPEDPAALSQAIEHVLAHRQRYDPAHLRKYALENFGWEHIASQTIDLYHQALGSFPSISQSKQQMGITGSNEQRHPI